MRFLIIFLLLCNVCFADNLYVIIKDNEVKGTGRILDKSLGAWKNKGYDLVKVGEEYSGKHGYEIKYVGGKLSLKSSGEVTSYEENQKLESENARLRKLKEDMAKANALP